MWCLCSDWNCFIAWLDKWQTLISGILAVAAAGITLVLLIRQIRLQKSQIDLAELRYADDRSRRALALRAKMPLSLDVLCGYLAGVLDWAWTPLDGIIGTKSGRLPPPLSAEAISAVADVLEHMDSSSARFAAHLLASYQILKARVGNSDRYSGEHIIACVVYLRWLTDEAYPYAWNRSVNYEPDASDSSIESAYDVVMAHNMKHWPAVTAPLKHTILPMVRSQVRDDLDKIRLGQPLSGSMRFVA